MVAAGRRGAPLEMKIAIGSDHAGFELKQKVAPLLEGAGHEVVDVGTGSDESTDYPLYAASAARLVAPGLASRSSPTRLTGCAR
jgi:ribose 5-phosphate isomerase B